MYNRIGYCFIKNNENNISTQYTCSVLYNILWVCITLLPIPIVPYTSHTCDKPIILLKYNLKRNLKI